MYIISGRGAVDNTADYKPVSEWRHDRPFYEVPISELLWRTTSDSNFRDALVWDQEKQYYIFLDIHPPLRAVIGLLQDVIHALTVSVRTCELWHRVQIDFWIGCYYRAEASSDQKHVPLFSSQLQWPTLQLVLWKLFLASTCPWLQKPDPDFYWSFTYILFVGYVFPKRLCLSNKWSLSPHIQEMALSLILLRIQYN